MTTATMKQPVPPLATGEEYRDIVVAADIATCRMRGFKVLNASPLTFTGCSAFPADGITAPSYVEFPVELPDGAINIFDIRVNGYVDMSFAPVVPPGTVIYEKRDETYDSEGNKTEVIRTLYHEGARNHDCPQSGADSGLRTLIANPAWNWENNDTQQRYVVVPQELALGVVSEGDSLRDLRVAVLSSRTPQTLEALHSYLANGLPCYWSATKPGPRAKRIVWIRLTGHRINALMVFSVSLRVRGVFSDGVTVSAHVRKPRAARKVKAKSSPAVQAAPSPVNTASASITLSEVTADRTSAAAQCGA